MPRDIPASPIQEDGLASAATHNRPPFVSLLAQVPQRVRLLTHLHQRAVETTGGRCSLLFEHNARNGGLQATSGFGLDNLQTDTWRPNAAEGELVSEAFANGAPLFVSNADSRMPELASRLGTDTALLLPLLQGGRRVGLLAVGFDDPTPALGGWERAAEAADSLVTALELFRLRRNEELQRALRQLVDDVSANLTMTLDLRAGLHVFCTRATPLFGADRTCVWLLDRRSRNLSLQAASDGANPDLQIDVDESLLPAAAALRSHRAEIQLGPGDMPMSTISVPLRGRRRALGTIVFEGVRIETGSEVDLLERADELGLQLSGAIENLQLLQDVIRSRRELENTFDSIAHLVVVTDRQGTIVHANRAFAERLGLARAEVVERPLTECIGPDLAAWHSSIPATEHQPAATLEVVDPMLKGPFMVTVTDLLDRDGHSTGRVL
ncbi:MAG: GAF domain-containing protein, partial [Vicinamibacterales bacterium]